jgi:hypothetical protein
MFGELGWLAVPFGIIHIAEVYAVFEPSLS